jgi:hypothetical protein
MEVVERDVRGKLEAMREWSRGFVPNSLSGLERGERERDRRPLQGTQGLSMHARRCTFFHLFFAAFLIPREERAAHRLHLRTYLCPSP